ncbi:MAG: glycosyltransferase family 1 protein [Veillonellales bacterium]
MIRVGFIIEDNGWLGGLNYFRNLFNAVYNMPERKFELVIFTGKNSSLNLFSGFPPVEIIHTSYFTRLHPLWMLHKIGYYYFHNDLFLERFLKRHHIDVLSHANFLSKNSSVPVLGWIPDFQCMYYPKLFSDKGMRSHESNLRLIAKYAQAVVVSSFDAKKDMGKFMPQYISKAKVLHFAVVPQNNDSRKNMEYLEDKYNIHYPYFYVPNQFWAHKNHKILIDALNILREKEIPITIVMTGKTVDPRQPEYFDNLMRYAQECNVLNKFRVLGIVPYSDVMSLLRNCLAVINPSFFEGWHTGVEEARSLGKPTLLSDIPIHREQDPSGGVFFNPRDSLDLAMKLEEFWSNSNNEEDAHLKYNVEDATARHQVFAKTYEKIILETIKGNYV